MQIKKVKFLLLALHPNLIGVVGKLNYSEAMAPLVGELVPDTNTNNESLHKKVKNSTVQQLKLDLDAIYHLGTN